MRAKGKRRGRGGSVSKPKPNAFEMHQMPQVLKKKRIMRKRMSLNKLIGLNRMMCDFCKRDCTTLGLAWMNVKRERSNKTIRRKDFSYPFADHILKESDEQCINHQQQFQSDRFIIVYERKRKRSDLNSAVEFSRHDVLNRLDQDQNDNAAAVDSNCDNQLDQDQNYNATAVDSNCDNQLDQDQNDNAVVDSNCDDPSRALDPCVIQQNSCVIFGTQHAIVEEDLDCGNKAKFKENVVSWAPLTPEIQSKFEPQEKYSANDFMSNNIAPDSSVKIGSHCGGETEDTLKNKNTENISKRVKMKRHRPKVFFDERKPIKISTPNLRTPKKNDDKRTKKVKEKADTCRRKLDFNEEGCTTSQEELKSQDEIKSSLDPPKIYKKKRMKKRHRISREKLANLIGIIRVLCTCTCGAESKIPKHSSENALLLQDEVLKEAMVDYAIQKMVSLHIVDDEASIQIVVGNSKAKAMQIVVGNSKAIVISKKKTNPSKNHKIMVDLDPDSERIWNLMMTPNWSAEDGEHMKGQQKLFRQKIDLFFAYMRVIQGDRQFSLWKGSVVDSIVGVFLTQNVSDNLSSSAYMAVASTYPPLSVSEQNSQFAHDDRQILLVGHPSSNRVGPDIENRDEYSSQAAATPITKKKGKEKQEEPINWDELKKEYSNNIPIKRTDQNADSINWEAVRQSSAEDLANVIVDRGMNNQLAGKIKRFLDRLVKDHGSIDLEWLRNVPPLKAKDYLLSIFGIAMKSTECVRLLSLHFPAFPIDVNAARVFVRLGWVPLKPLPNGVQFHLLNNYPTMESVQKFLWPRICDLGPAMLYELHCHIITFAKAFCTKTQPNCNHCPMRGECKHYASAVASSKPCLEGDSSTMSISSQEAPVLINFDGDQSHTQDSYEPVIEFPPSPGPLGGDIEDIGCYPEIMAIPLNDDVEFLEKISNIGKITNIEEIACDTEFPINGVEFSEKFQSFIQVDDEISQSMLTISPRIGSIPMPGLKEAIRLRTVHQVYELPDSHHLLEEFEERVPEDRVPYLLAIWTADETTNSDEVCSSQESTTSDARSYACSSSQVVPYEKHGTIQGTILIPCRTANGGRFALNGTYFQPNEVFADHASSQQPICVPISSILNLRKRTLYCGTSITSICKGMSCPEVAYNFNRSFICIRGFDTKIRAARSLKRIFHICKSRQANKNLFKNAAMNGK